MTQSNSLEQPRLYTEDEHGATVILKLSRNRNYPERFLTMFTKTMMMISSWDRPPCYHKALLFLLARLDPIQYRRVYAPEIAEATGMSLSSATRALAMLKADKVIIALGKTSQQAIRINMHVAWASSAERFNQKLSDGPDVRPEDARGR